MIVELIDPIFHTIYEDCWLELTAGITFILLNYHKRHLRQIWTADLIILSFWEIVRSCGENGAWSSSQHCKDFNWITNATCLFGPAENYRPVNSSFTSRLIVARWAKSRVRYFVLFFQAKHETPFLDFITLHLFYIKFSSVYRGPVSISRGYYTRSYNARDLHMHRDTL